MEHPSCCAKNGMKDVRAGAGASFRSDCHKTGNKECGGDIICSTRFLPLFQLIKALLELSR